MTMACNLQKCDPKWSLPPSRLDYLSNSVAAVKAEWNWPCQAVLHSWKQCKTYLTHLKRPQREVWSCMLCKFVCCFMSSKCSLNEQILPSAWEPGIRILWPLSWLCWAKRSSLWSLTWLPLFLCKSPSAHFLLILMGWELFTVIMGYIVKRPWCSGLFYWLPCLWVFPAASAILYLAFMCAVFYVLRSCVMLSASTRFRQDGKGSDSPLSGPGTA